MFPAKFCCDHFQVMGFGVFVQYFGKYQAKSKLDGRFCRILVKFCYNLTAISLKNDHFTEKVKLLVKFC